MDVWLVNPYGPLPGEGWRDYRFTLVARALARRGHSVTWWTASFAHQTRAFRSKDWSSESAGERFTIELVPTPSYSRNIGPGRLWFEMTFARRFLRRAGSLPRPDVIVAADPPQFCGDAARRLAARFGVPLIVDCLDLWPELFASAAPALARPLVRIASIPFFALRRRTLASADLVIAVAETYRRTITRSTSARKSVTIPIGVDVMSVAAAPVDHERVRVIYAGSLGEAYDLETVLAAAKMLKNEPVDFIIAGRGPAERRLRDGIARMSLTNVELVGLVPPDELRNFYARADVALAPYVAGSTVALPLKLFDYLAAGLPVITSLRGEALDVLLESGAGMGYGAGDPASLAGAISYVVQDRERRSSMAARARSAASRFDSTLLYERYASAIESAARPSDVDGKTEFRRMTRVDIDAVASLHLAAFPDFFLSSLGPRFLSQFYRAIADSADGVAVVAVSNGRIAGFAVGSLNPRGFYRRLFTRRSIPIAFVLLPLIALRPATLVKVVRRAVHRTAGGREPEGAELMSLAVSPAEQNHGTGRALLEAFIARVAAAETSSLWLTTDAVDNDSVKRFYEKAGFSKSRTYTTSEGRQLDEYRRKV